MRSKSHEDDIFEPHVLTRKERRKLRRHAQSSDAHSGKNNNLSLNQILPKTSNQQRIFDEYYDNQNLLIHGYPGTGKTFLASFLAIQDVLENGIFDKVVIVRSALSTRDIGHLPGTKKDKIKEYEAPYYEIFSKLFGRGDAYDILKMKGLVDFIPTSFIRGVTIDNAVVIVDEAQNLTFHENSSIITRLGDESRVIFCGDFIQSDHRFKDEKQGVIDFLDVVKDMKSFSHIEMGVDDIVRGPIVKEFIITCAKKGLI